MTDRLMVLSASAISCLKACPTQYRYKYHMGIRRAEEAEPLRMGNSWHMGQELMYLKPGDPCPQCPGRECPVCLGTGVIDDPLDAMARALSHRYANLWPGLAKETKEIERAMILYALFAYKYHYDEQPVDTITAELPFRIPLIDPRTRKAVPNVVIDGIIDKLVSVSGDPPEVMEHKSTSNDLDPSSDYWGHLRLDTQTYIYAYAAQRLQADGLLEPFGIKADDTAIGSILYDVWKKPGIRPKKLSQGETAKLLEHDSYYDREFECKWNEQSGEFSVDGDSVQVERLKSGAPVIRETADMYGCRLFNEINENPTRYFARRSITRTSLDIERFEWELYNIYRTVAAHIEDNAWFHNERECNSYGKCDYCQFCFTGQEIDPEKPPTGFVNIFEKGNR